MPIGNVYGHRFIPYNIFGQVQLRTPLPHLTSFVGWKTPKITFLALEILIIIAGKQSLVVFVCPQGCPRKKYKSWARVIFRSVIAKNHLIFSPKVPIRQIFLHPYNFAHSCPQSIYTYETLFCKNKKNTIFCFKREMDRLT